MKYDWLVPVAFLVGWTAVGAFVYAAMPVIRPGLP